MLHCQYIVSLWAFCDQNDLEIRLSALLFYFQAVIYSGGWPTENAGRHLGYL